MISIDIQILGGLYPFEPKRLESIAKKSRLFSITKIIDHINPEAFNDVKKIVISDSDIKDCVQLDPSADFTVVLVNKPLEGNFFSRRISDKLMVISVYGVELLDLHEGISIESFISRFIYGFVTIFKLFNSTLPPPKEVFDSKIMQEPAKGCLMDLCLYKHQAAIFFRQPKVCPETITQLRSKPIPIGFIETLTKEIQILKIGKYYLLKDWLKNNPIKAILLTFFIGLVFSEILGNYIYDLINYYLPLIH